MHDPMDYQVTIRYGTTHIRYHTVDVTADDVREAMESLAETLPEEVTADADLVELRLASDPDTRKYSEDPYDS